MGLKQVYNRMSALRFTIGNLKCLCHLFILCVQVNRSLLKVLCVFVYRVSSSPTL